MIEEEFKSKAGDPETPIRIKTLSMKRCAIAVSI